MKLSDLFESKTIILEAKHHDIWIEFKTALFRNLEKDLGKDSEDYTNAIEKMDLIIEPTVSDLFDNNIPNSWKQWLLAFRISITAQTFLDDLANIEAQATKRYLTKKLKNITSRRYIALDRSFKHYISLNYEPIENYNPLVNNDTPESFIEALESLVDDYENVEGEGLIVPTNQEKLLVKSGDFAWYDIGKSYCEDEKRAMRHCGNEAGMRNTTEKILSLRSKVRKGSKTFFKPHLTFILDNDGLLGEMKGYANNKPTKKYHEAIIALLKLDIIKGIKGGGAIPKNNFSLEDLTQSQLKDLEKSKGEEWMYVEQIATNPKSIQYIENPSQYIQTMAIQREPLSIKYIDNPTEFSKRLFLFNMPEGVTYEGYMEQDDDTILALVGYMGLKHVSSYMDNKPSENLQVKLVQIPYDNDSLHVLFSQGIIPSDKVLLAAAKAHPFETGRVLVRHHTNVEISLEVLKTIVEADLKIHHRQSKITPAFIMAVTQGKFGKDIMIYFYKNYGSTYFPDVDIDAVVKKLEQDSNNE